MDGEEQARRGLDPRPYSLIAGNEGQPNRFAEDIAGWSRLRRFQQVALRQCGCNKTGPNPGGGRLPDDARNLPTLQHPVIAVMSWRDGTSSMATPSQLTCVGTEVQLH